VHFATLICISTPDSKARPNNSVNFIWQESGEEEGNVLCSCSYVHSFDNLNVYI